MSENRQLALDHLSQIGIITLLTIDTKGYPTGRRVGFVNEGFVIEIPTMKHFAKMRQIRANPKATLSHFDGQSYRYTNVKADVEVIEDPDYTWAMRERYARKYPRTASGLTPESREQYVTLRLIPREVRVDSLPGPGQSVILRGADVTID